MTITEKNELNEKLMYMFHLAFVLIRSKSNKIEYEDEETTNKGRELINSLADAMESVPLCFLKMRDDTEILNTIADIHLRLKSFTDQYPDNSYIQNILDLNYSRFVSNVLYKN